MADPGGSKSELEKGMEASPSGHPVVLFGLNAVLSTLFAFLTLYLGSLVGVTEVTPIRVAMLTLILMLIAHVISSP